MATEREIPSSKQVQAWRLNAVLPATITVILAFLVALIGWMGLAFGKTSPSVIWFYVSNPASSLSGLNSELLVSLALAIGSTVALSVFLLKLIERYPGFAPKAPFPGRRWLPAGAMLTGLLVLLGSFVSLEPVGTSARASGANEFGGATNLGPGGLNIIHIFVESLASNVTLPDGSHATESVASMFPWTHASLLPQSAGHLDTISGLVGSLCGVAFPREDFLREESPRFLVGDTECLGDSLGAAGYTQAFFGGADLSFQNKGDFLKSRQIEAFGKEDWELLGETRMSSWGQGLHDTRLFERVKGQLRYLSQSESQQPFALTILTLDTHYPYYKDPYCALDVSPNDEAGSFACTLEALKDFLGWLEQFGLTENTVVIVQGDHVPLKSTAPETERIAFFAFSPKPSAKTTEAPESIFDVMRFLIEISKVD